MEHDLLEQPLLSWRNPQRDRAQTTLPGILAHLAAGDLGDFPRLRTHQFDPWCMFLTQLAAIALHRADLARPPTNETVWRDLLLALTDGAHEPWCVFVEDLAQPAFFQPPVPEGSLKGWKMRRSPDDIDILVTAKAHDVKAGLIPGDDVEAWVYALVTLQTTQGYPGRGYTGISRMKGGYGNRPRVGVSPDQGIAGRFLRDVEVLRDAWPKLLGRGYRDTGVALVWTTPWDGRTSLSMGDLAPHFIELCWRIRCVLEGGLVVCCYTTTTNRRCLPEVDNGDVGDPWAPIERDAGVLTVGSRGFHYDLLRRLLFEDDFEPAAAQAPRPSDPDLVLLVATALARGQGKTEGLHERVLTLPRPVRLQLGKPDTRAQLGKRAGERVLSTQKMHSKVLYPALMQLGGLVGDEFDALVDETFFDHLFTTLADGDEDARLSWDRRLRDLAASVLQRAISRCSLPSARRLRFISAAEGMFAGCLKKQFPDIDPVRPATEGAVS